MENRSNSTPANSLLLVEDDDTTLQCLAMILAKKFPHMSVATAGNGRAGLELFQAQPAAIVITDFNMPEMGGMEMTGRMRAIRPETRFIILTGDSGGLALRNACDKLFIYDHFIVKPVVFDTLFAAIEQCLEAIGNCDNHLVL
jgi:YesN/AraC family two-component response regulator